MSRVGGGGDNFQKQLKVVGGGGGVHFSVMARKGGTVFTLCVFIPKVTCD